MKHTVVDYRLRMTEEQMQGAIEDLVSRLGGISYHLNDARKAPELVNLPDLLIILPRRQMVVFAELKSQKRAVTAGQRMVLDMLSECSQVHTFCVRPEPENLDELSYDSFITWLGGG